jgi:hypothetical protein
MIFDDHVRWLWRNIAATGSSELLVVGGVDAGKTTFFEQLEEVQPHQQHGTLYRYWDCLKHPHARDREGFTSVLAQRLRVSGSLGAGDPFHRILDLLEQDFPGQRTMLVLDHWDQGLENPALQVDVGMLHELHGFVRSAEARGRIGLIMVTRFPTPRLLFQQARLMQAAGLMFFSGDMGREINNVASFPHLGRPAVGELLDQLECPRELHGLVHAVCGGWIGLLVEAAVKVTAAHSQKDLAAALQGSVAYMLQKSLLPAMTEMYTSNPADPWNLVMRELDNGADPLTAFGLPVTESGRLPAALLAFRRPPPMMLVDLPQLRAVLTLADTPDDQVDARAHRVIEFVRSAHGVPEDRVRKLEHNFTPARATDSRTEVVLLTGRPLSLLVDPRPSDVVVVTPGAAAAELPATLPPTWRIEENAVHQATGGAHAG